MCERVVLEEAFRIGENLLVGLIQPLLIVFRQKAHVDEISAVWDHGDVLESKVRFVAERMLRLDLADNGKVLDADTVGAILVIARLNGQDVSCGKWHVDILLPSANADWSLVNAKIRSYTMSRPVTIVKARFLEVSRK